MEKAYKAIKGDPAKNAAKANALTALEAARTKANRALATLNWLQSNRTQEEIDQKYTDLALAQGKLADAEEALRKLTGPSAEDIALAKAVVADAQETLDTLQSGPTQSDLTVAQTRVTQAQAELAKSKLTAPFAGTITNVDVMTGDIVKDGTLAFQIDDLSRLFIDLQVSEMDIPQIKAGQTATITFDAISDKEYQGKVTRIGMVGTNSQGVVNYPVTVEILDGDANILPGMTAAVNIIVSQAEDVLVVPNQAVRSIGGQHTVTVLFEGQQIQIPVTIGLVGDTMTEITGTSLKEGDEVVTNTGTSTSTTSSNARGPQFRQEFGPGDGGGVFIAP
jgi:RND family efflux transporter MFP subunit